jgi:hypothetical protein
LEGFCNRTLLFNTGAVIIPILIFNGILLTSPFIKVVFMKFRSFLLMVMVCAGVFSMSSCVKNYTCHCDIKYSGKPGLPDSTAKEYDIADTKSSAKSKCEAESGTYQNNGIHTDENCYLY